jgi:hypothetical protein
MARGFKPPVDDERCIATTRKGTRCPKYRVRGTTVCLAHGAKAPQVRAAAQRRVEAEAVAELAERVEVDLPEFKSGAEAARYLLERVARRSAQFGRLADDLGDRVTYADRAGVERLCAAVAGERAWLDSLAKVLSVAVAAEAAQRAQAGTASGVIDRVMLALELSMTNVARRYPQLDGLREEMSAEFRQVAKVWTSDHADPERSRSLA